MLSFVNLIKGILKSFALIISVVLLTACRTVTPVPTVMMTATNIPSITTLDVTPTTPQPMLSTTSTSTSIVVNKIRLYHNQTATHATRDQYSFSVVVDKGADFTPKSIQIVEQGTGSVIGQYELFDQTEIESLCENLMQNPDLKFYETDLIDYSSVPQGFIIRAYEGDFIFRITIEYSSGALETIERATPDNGCETHIS
jgi:hypothetical protein